MRLESRVTCHIRLPSRRSKDRVSSRVVERTRRSTFPARNANVDPCDQLAFSSAIPLSLHLEDPALGVSGRE